MQKLQTDEEIYEHLSQYEKKKQAGDRSNAIRSSVYTVRDVLTTIQDEHGMHDCLVTQGDGALRYTACP